MKHIIDTVSKLKKECDVMCGDSPHDVRIYNEAIDDVLDAIRALIANSPQADEMVKDLSKIARQLSSLADNGVTETLPDAMREASKQIFARLSNKTTGAETLLSAYKPQADDVRKDALVEKAKKMYIYMTDNHPTIHTNRFPTWDEISEEEKNEWIYKATKL